MVWSWAHPTAGGPTGWAVESLLSCVLVDFLAFQVFALFDDDGTGAISFRNLKRVATELGENLTDEELQEMIGKEAALYV